MSELDSEYESMDDDHPYEDPRTQRVTRNVGFFNAAGLANKITDIQTVMTEQSCSVTLVTETKQHCNQNSTSHPYVAASSRPPNVRAGVPTKHGVALLACTELWGAWRNEITVQATDSEGHYLIWTHGEAQFIGLYLPPITNQVSLIEARRILDATMLHANV